MDKFLVIMESKDQSEQPVNAYVRAVHFEEAGRVGLSMLRDQLKTDDDDLLNRYYVVAVERAEDKL
jgi:hypothetical protein